VRLREGQGLKVEGWAAQSAHVIEFSPLSDYQHIAACHCCGLLQRLPPSQPRLCTVCSRCGSSLRHRDPNRNRWAAALALSALLIYPAAIGLPLLNISKLGHSSTDSLLSGLVSMFSQGYWLVGGVVLLFSILLPPLKLMALWLLTSQSAQQSSGLMGHRPRALLYHAVELLGRWGMLDVMLVAVLVAMVKLGDLVQIQPGPGLWAFTLMVLLSLLASMVFNPTQMWSEHSSDD